MGIIKLFSKYRDENNTSAALKYDQRRHSSISLFSVPHSVQQLKLNNKPRHSMAFEGNMIRNRDSAIVTSTPGFTSVQNEELPDSVTSTFNPIVNRDVQNAVQTLRKESSDTSIQKASGSYNRYNKSKSVSLNGVKCTCNIPHSDVQNKNRVSAPIIKMDSSNKYEYSVNRKKDQQSSENDIFGDVENLDHTLNSDLVTAQQILQSILNYCPPFANKSIERVVNRLAYAIEKSSYLESRLNTVIEVSKQTILHKADQLKELEKQNESEIKSLSSALKDNEVLKSRLIEAEDLITKIKYVLHENQIEPSQKDGGTILQQIESLLAMSTSSYLFNEKLASELDHSDKRILELMTQVDELNAIIADLQKSQNNDAISDLKNKIVQLEEQIVDLNIEIRSSKDTIQLLDQEKTNDNAQLKSSNNLLKKKISEMELYNNTAIESLEKENYRLREENVVLKDQKQSAISDQEATDRSNEQYFNIQKDDKKKKIQDRNISVPNQSSLAEKCNPSTEKLNEQNSLDSTHVLELKNNTILDGENPKNSKDPIKDLQRTFGQFLTGSQSTERLHIKSTLRSMVTDNATRKELEIAQETEEVPGNAEKSEEEKRLTTPKSSLLEFSENRINKGDKLPLPDRFGRHKIQVQYFEKQYQKYKTGFSGEALERITQECSNLHVDNSEIVRRTFNDKIDELKQDMMMPNNNNLISSAEKRVLEYEFKRKSFDFNKEGLFTLSKEKAVIRNAEETNKSTYSTPLNIGFPTKISLSSNTKHGVDKEQVSSLEYQLKLITSLQQENNTLHELLDCLQNKVRVMTFGESTNKLQDTNSSTSKNLFFRGIENREQEELLKMHTRAQLGLIEYLEGEDNVSLAISRFRKLLEIQMKDFEC